MAKISFRNKDFIITSITEFFALLTGVLVYKLASNLTGESGFSEYALARRTISFIQPALMLGIGVGITRYIAFAVQKEARAGENSYFISGSIIIIAFTILILIILLLFKDSMSYLLFGSEDYYYLITPICIMLSGLIIHALCYAYFRGKLLMIKANILQFINLCIVPIFCFYLSSQLTIVLYYTGIIWLATSIIFFILIISRLKINTKELKTAGSELLYYGIQRVPGDFGIAALLALPAFFVSHITNDIIIAGYVAFGITLVNLAGSAFVPLSLILLPEASQIVAKKQFSKLKSYSKKIIMYTLIITILGVLIFIVPAGYIIHLYLGNNSPELIYICRIIIISSIGYTLYISLRSILDAFYVKAVNTLNILISLLVFIVLYFSSSILPFGYIQIIYIFVFSQFVLGALTLLKVKKISKRNS